MTMNPLDIHEFFKCSRSSFDGLEHYYKPVEVKVSPQLDWDEFANIDDFEKLFKPRIDRTKELGSAWERHLLSECLRMGVWRIWFVQWCEFTETAAFMNTKVFPPWEIKQAQAFAKKVGENLTCLNLRDWLLMGTDEFIRKSGASPNKDVMAEMRRVMSKRCQRKCRK